MATLKSFLTGSLLALGMFCGVAQATPINFHVDLYTAPFIDQVSGYLELSVAGPGTGVPVTAFASNFSGVGSDTILYPGAVAENGGFRLPAPDSAVWLAVTFGGKIGFDLSFDLGTGTVDGTRFTASFVNSLGEYFSGTLGQIDLYAGAAPSILGGDLTIISEVPDGTVPEPADLALLVTGLGLMGLMRRRMR